MTESVFDRITEAYGSRLEHLNRIEKWELLAYIAASHVTLEKHSGMSVKDALEHVNFDVQSADALEVITMLGKSSRRELLSFSHAIVSQLSQE
ncbi:hypothetical protein [Kamptonema sp. UHCC 0994]|uniref:hypothetical protein n=1 Tax=Kamptonema sp. UHCC 0994 TaxID=3031329 RepID=UPI0023B947A1|nr:hypothetical protein [Kamptonema sp. UHCC 0994]MDF0553150.1 hypothetical protein [Kamptonema sp. UHCC 0994]